MRHTTLHFSLLAGAVLLAVSAPSWSALPWSIVPTTATTLTVPSNATATVQYTVTNNSAKSHMLKMKAITGITQTTTGLGVCTNPFTLIKGASCTLSLQITGSALNQNIQGGPVVCQLGVNGQPDPQQCYQPARPDQTLNITTAPSVALGDSFGGGTVICLGGAPYMNLIVSTVDQSNAAAWGPNNNPTFPSPSSDDDGSSNTNNIISAYGTQGSDAAQLCHNYNGGGYTDWFLPAKNQLACVCANKSYITYSNNSGYWSSTESGVPYDAAWYQVFSDNCTPQGEVSKDNPNLKVRCVRTL